MNHEEPRPKTSSVIADGLWDLWCIASVIGIWPRFIEPNIITTTKLNLRIEKLPTELRGLKILQISDLHFNAKIPEFFIQKLLHKVKALHPDLIVFTGDFLCESKMQDETRLRRLLRELTAPHGSFAIFGNHDYSQCVSINSNGDYDIKNSDAAQSVKGFKRLFASLKPTKQKTPHVDKLEFHEELMNVLHDTTFQVLENNSKVIPIGKSHLNICGLGEYMLGRCRPEQAFQSYDERYPGVILAHNPDSIPLLKSYPGDVVLCGHTHGGQVNLPWITNKLTVLENMQYRKGLFTVDGKWIYVNRGLGGTMRFRWFNPPELTLITLR